ncbi:MAG: C10 family peptidase [Bacteroidales bacterium]|nr:C10 family peptidase [Bacteroidales bacterium]
MKQLFFVFAALLMIMVSCDTINQSMDIRLQVDDPDNQFRIPHSMAPLSQEDAILVARRFVAMNENQTKSSYTKTPESVYSIEGSSDNPAVFAINYGDNDGFVIVNASKKYFPILAYSETGHFSENRNPSGLDVWLEEQRSLIETAENLPIDSLKEITKAWRDYEINTTSRIPTKAEDDTLTFRDEAIAEWEANGFECMDLATSSLYLNPTVYSLWCSLAQQQSNPNYNYMQSAVVLYYGTTSTPQVGPLLSTTWGQWEPYNDRIPMINNERPPAGCSIAAMAQIMRYHQWPTLYPWSTMSNSTATYYTKVLYYNLGRDAQTSYSLSGSSTNINNLKNAITGSSYHYHYNASVANHSYATTKSNINNYKPVFMQGYDSSSGEAHAWVCDGVKTYTTAIYLALMVYTVDDKYMQAENSSWYSDSNSYEYLHHCCPLKVVDVVKS